ncbi:glycosyltransferase family 4 protein [Cupriavidus taiwanensis]|uniref:glycosyltransferase family 4 protein n=1 Tax=Cupriavidus taiwanensis TaxID=164546 RepID=UPI0018DB5084|nr:glycosyltransferase family 4 protein [Cupriavidus taiwanensis]
MRVLFTNFHRGNGGGHDTYVMNLVTGLKPAHQVAIAAPKTSRLFRLASGHAGVAVTPVDFAPRGLGWLREIWILWRLISLGRFDVIHVNGSADHKLVMLVRMIALRRPRIVYTKHNDHRCRSFGNWLRAQFGTDHVIAVSDYVAAKLRNSTYRRVPLSTVPHGLDTAYFAPPARTEAHALRERYFGMDRACTVFVSSAGTRYEKGWTDLLEAIAQLPGRLRSGVRVVLAGEAPLPCMTAKVAELGLSEQVLFTGLLDDVRPVLAAGHAAFVLSRSETLSFACREAMAMGLPVLVSDAGGLPENVTDGQDGWVMPCADVGALGRRLAQILAAPDRLVAMGEAARVKSEACFGMAAFIAGTLAVYQAVLEPDTSPRPLPAALAETSGR